MKKICQDSGLDVDSKVVTDIVTKSVDSNQTNKHVYAYRITHDTDIQGQVNNELNYALNLIFTLLKGKKHTKEKEILLQTLLKKSVQKYSFPRFHFLQNRIDKLYRTFTIIYGHTRCLRRI